MTSIKLILLFILDIAWWIIIIQAILSWLVAFDVINTRNQFVRQVGGALNRLTEPVYAPIRNALPATGGIDLAPLVVLVILYALQVVIRLNL